LIKVFIEAVRYLTTLVTWSVHCGSKLTDDWQRLEWCWTIGREREREIERAREREAGSNREKLDAGTKV
jgi:hypothetical protein